MKRKIISVIATFILIVSSHFSMIYALDKPNLNLNKKEDSVEVTLNLPKVENGLDAVSGKIDYDQNKLELVKVKQVSKKLKTPQYNETNGKFILLINSKTINESTDAVRFTFKIKENITEDTTIKVTELTGATSKDQKITLDDTQTVLSTDKKTNSSNNTDTSKGNDSKGDTNKSDTSNKTNTSNTNNDEKNTDKQNNVISNQSLNKEETNKETVSANKTDQKTSVTEETRKDTTHNNTTDTDETTSQDSNESTKKQTNSKQKKKKENQKNINEKLIVVKKESMHPNILLIFVAVVIFMLLLLITRYRKK